MRKLFTSGIMMLTAIIAASFTAEASNDRKSPVEYVNPMVGTDFHGHTFPGATYPFGMVQLSPDTREANWDGCSGYHYSDSVIRGFSHTHLSGTGCADLCDILVMPVVNFNNADEIFTEQYESPFSHDNESASPGYYSVFLDKWGVKAELTAGKRIGIHQYTYPEDVTPQIVIDLEPRDEVIESHIETDGNRAVKGFRRSRSWSGDQTVYFYMQFSRPMSASFIDCRESEYGAKALISFRGTAIRKKMNRLVIKVGISSVSEENAKANLHNEEPNRSFSKVLESTRKAWEEFLSKIEVEGDEGQKSVFYTALYHTAIAPNLYSDLNGEYRGMDRKVHTASGFDRYTTFSCWDTFRTLHPLMDILEPARTADFINSALSIYEEGGKLPRWELSGYETDCMIGYDFIPVIADAMVKGIGGFDCKKALEAMKATANIPEFGIDVYRDNGLVLADLEHESVSKTLEYACNDWCIAAAARIMNDPDTTLYLKRARYYRNLFDPSTSFMRPRVNGMWLKDFDPREVNVHYTEANSWQYSFHVQQDVSGLIGLLGGEVRFCSRLDSLFLSDSRISGWNSADITGMIGQYSQGNEPSHHIAYLYAFCGEPWKSQEVVSQIMNTLFTSEPDGLCGNEDCGQMSAWYVMSALGFYPVTPASGEYVLGTPLFKKAAIHLDNGADFTVEAPDADREHIYIRGVTRNGKPYDKCYITHDDVLSGCTFTFDMCDTPCTGFGTAPENRPHSAIPGEFVENPWFKTSSATANVFRTKAEVGIEAMKKEYKILYRILPEDTNGGQSQFLLYCGPLTISDNCTIEAFCEGENGARSFITRATFRKVSTTYGIQIKNRYSRQYTAGGDEGLLDGIRGTKNFRLGGWQGYQDTDFEAVVDLKKLQRVKSIGAGFLQDAKSWIWLPKYVEFYTSTDGKEFHFAGRLGHDVDEKDLTPQIHDIILNILKNDGTEEDGIEARYVKVIAKNFGTIPSWHAGAGNPAFIFTDEIVIR